MKKINNYWVDKNNNKWNCDSFTEEKAIKNSNTLINCFHCHNCSYCSDCHNCSHCHNCSSVKRKLYEIK